MNLEDRKTLCRHQERTMQEMFANHNHNLSLAGKGTSTLRVKYNCDNITTVAECYKSRKLKEFIK